MSHLVIVGAGPAGLFAAGHAMQLGHSVTVVEHMDSPGKKLLITGKGRCNVTNNCDEQEFLKNVRHNPRFLYSAVYSFPPASVMSFFEEDMAVPLKTERGRRVFPQSDRAQDILQALLRHADGAQHVKGQVVAVVLQNGSAKGVKLQDGRKIEADAVLVATGGVSYPNTGSTGIGYKLARQAGHNIIQPVPSLVSMVERGSLCRRMMGLSLRNVNLTLLQDGKRVFSEQGEMLFTHFGLSGPLVLSASAYLGDMKKHSYAASIDLKPALTAEQLDARIQRDFNELLNKDVANALDKLLPAKMRPVALEQWGVPPMQKVNQVTREQRKQLVELIKDFRVEIAQRGDLEHAVITAGGVDVKEVDPKTMQSKLVQGLYFAGEVLDVDAYTGGYNLQIAWCTAYAAANAIEW